MRCKVLVVDDEHDIADLLRLQFISVIYGKC